MATGPNASSKARHISDPLAASLMRAAAARHFERSAELENAGANPSLGPTAMKE